METKEETRKSRPIDKVLPWINLVIASILIGLGIWYLSGKVSFEEIYQSMILADVKYIVLGLVIVILTALLKTWRWQMMLITADDIPAFSPLFWSMMLGQYVNLIVPFLRLGEIARVYALNRQLEIPMARSLGTLVLEKVLDMFMLVLAIAFVLPLVLLPGLATEMGSLLWALPAIALAVLVLLAYKTELVTRFLIAVQEKIPTRLVKRLIQWSISGLDGLSALRNRRLSLLLVISSALILLLSVLLPYVIFLAFDLPFGLLEAAVVHIVVTIVTTPPSTPGKIGVFNGATAFALFSFGLKNEAVVISYSIVFHLVAILPQIILGGIAAVKTDWRWQKSGNQPLAVLK